MSTSVKESAFLFLVSFVLITLFSASSFLYPLNPWDDANVFMTIGKAMLSGKHLYTDIFDQKGPVLFFIHEFAALVSYKSFFGIYLIEILCYWGFLWYSHKIMRLFSNSWIVMPLTCLIGLVVVTTDFFFYGDSVEEFSLPILSYTLYYILSYLKTLVIPSKRILVFVGVGMGIIFWMKFTIVVFHFAALIGLLYICYRNNKLQDLYQITLWIIAGFVLLSVPCILYFVQNGTLADMFDAYFYTNLFQYGGSAANGEPDAPWFFFVKLAIAAILVLPVAFTKVRWDFRLLVVMCYGLQMLSFTLWSVNIYYFLVVFVYAPLVIYFLRNVECKRIAASIMILTGIIATATSYNFVTLVNGTFHRGIIPIAQYVNAHKTKTEDVLTFSSHETGIYLLADVLPPNRFFFAPNATKPEIRTEQAECIRNQKPKFLIRKTDPVKTTLVYYDMPIPEDYRLVCHERELFRYHFLLNPKMFLWNLGYTQGLMKNLVDKNTEQQNLYLYERNN
ncbi:MAG: hypothetical protein J5630_06490 [Bacteroidaceae bacterium]|nr:hypothetical protein [Bacteroidaceae bacterium]